MSKDYKDGVSYAEETRQVFHCCDSDHSQDGSREKQA